MIPKYLHEWTYELISDLCSAGNSESDRHDFKFNLAALHDATKICCAFANSEGGFIVVGVQEKSGKKHFEILGIDPDTELYGKFLQKVKADPGIDISPPKIIEVPGTAKLLYVLEIPKSSRRPHLPTQADHRWFWKRQGSDCVQMTLEEIRYQMNSYEEKREKLALLLIELRHICRTLEAQSTVPDNSYTGETFNFEIIDRVIVEAYSFLKQDINTVGAMDMVKRSLMLLNAKKQTMLSVLSLSYDQNIKNTYINDYRKLAKSTLPIIMNYTEQTERSFKEKFDITNPFFRN